MKDTVNSQLKSLFDKEESSFFDASVVHTVPAVVVDKSRINVNIFKGIKRIRCNWDRISFEGEL